MVRPGRRFLVAGQAPVDGNGAEPDVTVEADFARRTRSLSTTHRDYRPGAQVDPVTLAQGD
jgi:hypothetical protein